MKKKNIISFVAASAMILSSVPFAASAESEIIYGTMNIPYNDFYAAEFGESSNVYEVDAMSSATTAKWSKNGEGELFEGTYNQANEDGTGSILGVTYPVAITQAELDSLGENNYNFTALDSEPAAYKTVTVTDGIVSFSAVQDNTPITADGASIKLNTSTPWGDYLIDFENLETSAIYGALIRTTDGNTYAMRHEENIWRGELAWSSGIKTSEPHGNTLSYENFVSLMGSTISEVVFITLDGYTTVSTETYVPVKFASEVAIDNAESGTGKTAMTLTGFPDDFDKSYTVNDERFTVTDTEISYTDALPASYTLTISDSSGKYADVSGSFTLSTDNMPATYSDGKLVKADGAEDSDFVNFVNNISIVMVNGKEYTASGKGSVKIIGDDGTIDFAATSRNENVFDGSSNYTMTVSATGYNNPLDIEIKAEAPVTTTETPVLNTTATTSKTMTATTVKPASATTAKTTASPTDSPKTGVAGMAVPLTAMALAGVSAFVCRKKND